MENEIPATKSKPTKPVERVTLEPIQSEKVSNWLKQLADGSCGFLAPTRSDIVNFLVRIHKSDLSPREVQEFRQLHYDPVRHMNWIASRLKEAPQVGDFEKVNALQSELRRVELNLTPNSSGQQLSELGVSAGKRRARRKREDTQVPETPSHEESPLTDAVIKK